MKNLFFLMFIVLTTTSVFASDRGQSNDLRNRSKSQKLSNVLSPAQQYFAGLTPSQRVRHLQREDQAVDNKLTCCGLTILAGTVAACWVWNVYSKQKSQE